MSSNAAFVSPVVISKNIDVRFETFSFFGLVSNLRLDMNEKYTCFSEAQIKRDREREKERKRKREKETMNANE